jgi:hypothetical protein
MSQVICTSKYAQTAAQLGGKKFFASEVGRISEELTDDEATEFLKTPTHFRLHVGDPVEEKKPSKKVSAAPSKSAQKSESSENAQVPGF